MLDVYEQIRANPGFYRQLRCGDSFITQFNSTEIPATFLRVTVQLRLGTAL